MLELIAAFLIIPWLIFWVTAAIGAIILLIAIGYFGHWLVTRFSKKTTKK